MKKYKLIKEYPGSPKLGEIAFMIYGDSIECYPEFWQEMKQPLFTTEDGVEIFENDRYWSVKTNWVICEYVASIHYTFPTIRFSTKEATEEYILMNKPCLSINDIISKYGVTTSKLIKMKELVKSKL